jgi:hypothetical protein
MLCQLSYGGPYSPLINPGAEQAARRRITHADPASRNPLAPVQTERHSQQEGCPYMKPSFLLGVAVGYLLGSRAGRERYEDIVAIGRRIAGSQTIQATAGVVQAQVQEVTDRAKGRLGGKHPHLHGVPSANGHRSA